ncbi:MAG: hypothetical protein AAGI48_14635 [Verrucomicrobiota bacterium]
MKAFLIPLTALILASCSTLPNPSQTSDGGDRDRAIATLKQSADTHGYRWRSQQKVEVAYDGEWTGLATRIQPVLTDTGFRKSSVETYLPASNRVTQTHQGPEGTKQVTRTPGKVRVSYNGKAEDDPEQLAASALVADAYTAFLFGPSWLLAKGGEFDQLEARKFDGRTCELVSGVLRPGFGRSESDRFIAWIDRETLLMRRLQFTLNGLESTQGADVDVVFSEMVKTADGSVWPTHFLEKVHRPFLFKAHEWRMTGLKTNGVKQSLD